MYKRQVCSTQPDVTALPHTLQFGILLRPLSLSSWCVRCSFVLVAQVLSLIHICIGLFISIVGLKGAGVIVANESTLVALGNVGDASVALALIGIALIGIMLYYNIKGAILWGILITWVLGIFAQLSGWYTGVSVLPDFANNSFIAGFAGMGEIAFKFDFSYAASNVVDFAVIVFAFLFVDLFDTVGTLIGVAAKGDMLDKEGKLPRVGNSTNLLSCRKGFDKDLLRTICLKHGFIFLIMV